MQSLELNTFLQYKYLSALRYAPDGERAAFCVSNAAEGGESYESRLWLYEGGDFRQMTDLGKERSFVWEDARTLLFPADRSAAEKKRREAKESFTAYYRLRTDGGEAPPAFTLPFAASALEPLGNGLYAALGAIERDFPDYATLSPEERAAHDKEKADNADYEVLEELPFWGNGQGMHGRARTAFFLFDANSNAATRFTAPTADVFDMKRIDENIYLLAADYETHCAFRGYTLFKFNLPSRTLTTLRADAELYAAGLYTVGGELWLSAARGEKHGLNEGSLLYRVDTQTGALSLVTDADQTYGNSVGSDCRLGGGRSFADGGAALYTLLTENDSCVLRKIAKDGTVTPVCTEKGSADCFDISPKDGSVLIIGLYGMRLQEVYALDENAKPVCLSHFNDEVLKDKYVAQPQPLHTQSGDLAIEGYVLLPKDYDAAKTYPAVFDIHGGPKTVYGPVFYHEMQLWANMGYFVFFCNPKGSDGRGNAFMDIRGDYGGTDYKNLMDFADAVLKAYPQIDKTRVCETGGSYGGFMTNWIIGHTNRFCCAASQRSISNWLSFWGVSDIGPDFAEDQNACREPYTDPEILWEHSPLKYAANAVTPTLFIHSDEDYRCPLEQGLQMYSALARRGVPTRMCLFHGENHELSRSGKPKHRVRRLTEITNWFEKYTRQ